MKFCLACSGGGHLTELMQLKEFYTGKDHFFLTFKRPNSIDLSKTEKVYFVVDPKRNPLLLLINFAQSCKVFFRELPDAVITTGAGVAFPISLIARVFGKKVVYIESFCRIDQPSWSGKFFYPLASLFLVQWPQQKKFFKKAKYFGAVF
ncbi:MAG: UDP-N-acetylglucosamine--LPS N-acetylglucosamine transferase [Candidatus Diapherotrites archaeon]|nr:UDP-N-acetylglucosamine--LPS N-acetylglucosamine transferase [Candidatus Diapherotrites archaeon]